MLLHRVSRRTAGNIDIKAGTQTFPSAGHLELEAASHKDAGTPLSEKKQLRAVYWGPHEKALVNMALQTSLWNMPTSSLRDPYARRKAFPPCGAWTAIFIGGERQKAILLVELM